MIMKKIKEKTKEAWEFAKDPENRETLAVASPIIIAAGWYLTRGFEAVNRSYRARLKYKEEKDKRIYK